MSDSDRREYARFNSHIVVEISSADGTSYTGVAEDLSALGFFLPTDTPLPLDTPCHIVLTSESRLQISGEGIVVRSNNKGMAIKLSKIAKEDLDTYQRLIGQHSNSGY